MSTLRLTALLALGLAASAVAAAADSPQIENSVVRITATVRPPDYFKPWTKQAGHTVSGSGVIIEGKRILTNAHVVLYASQLLVQGNQSGEKLPATVEFVAPGIDLALLKLEDDAFFDTRPRVARATTLPAIKDAVMAYGFPTGGTGLAITKGIVSRIDFTPYNFPTNGLRIQIDAAINPGNSGGPALSGDKMIGLAFSRLTAGDNIGYIIPCEEIETFLADAADGRYDGKPSLYQGFQPLQNPALRAMLKLPSGTTGVFFPRIEDRGKEYPLKPWDVITRVGDVPIDDEGMVKHDAIRVQFGYMVQRLAKDGAVPLTVLRSAKEQVVMVPVFTEQPMLVPPVYGTYPPYFIYGPLVFSTPTFNVYGTTFTSGANKSTSLYTVLGATGSPLLTRRHEPPAFPGEELVMISSALFPHRIGRGYSTPQLRVVKDVNGTPIKNLAHLVEVLRDGTDEFVIFNFHEKQTQAIVLRRAEVAAATDEILSDNGIRAQASSELLAIWGGSKKSPTGERPNPSMP